jgi:uncharacterized membrane protein YdjX (TVP38/TMEM64 family)
LKEELLHLFQQHPQLAVGISLTISIVVAVLGLVPSVFITAANLLFFGFWNGTLLSFVGEVIGAAVAFFLYRTGFKKTSQQGLQRFPKVARLLHAQGKEAFLLVFSLRLIPFVPSGLVTFAAAIGKVSAAVFLLASSLGKIPALLLEAYSVYQAAQAGWPGKLLLAVVAVVMLYLLIKKRNPSEG